MPLMLAQPGYFVPISKHLNCRLPAFAQKEEYSFQHCTSGVLN
jgi:hypothetical protein